jgi:putative ABC transport system permease protein
MKFFHLIWSNLKRKKLRTILTLFSIVMAFILFSYLSAIRAGFGQGVTLGREDRLLVRHKTSIIHPLPEFYKARMERIPGVAVAMYECWFGGEYQDPKNFFPQLAVVPEEFLEMYPENLLPPDQKQAWFRTRTGAIVGRKTAERFHFQIGDKIPLRSSIWGGTDGSRLWEFDIVGIFDARDETTDTTLMFFHYDYLDERRAWAKGEVGWYIVRVQDASQAAEVAKLVDQEFENSSAETKTEPEGAFLNGWIKQIVDVTLIIATILSAVFFTILLVTGNTMSQSVRERTGELGVLKAMGFTNVQVLALVLAESCLLALLGGGIGLGAGWLMVAQGDPTGGLLALFFFPTRDVLVGIGMACALGLLAGIFPALGAMRLGVADALRRM